MFDGKRRWIPFYREERKFNYNKAFTHHAKNWSNYFSKTITYSVTLNNALCIYRRMM